MVVKLKNMRIQGFNTGISMKGGDLDAENVTFDDVQTPYDLQNMNSVSIQDGHIQNDPKVQPRRAFRQSSSFSGWLPSDKPAIPVYCDRCKSIFPSQNYKLEGLWFNLWNNREECIVCQHPNAKLAEGVFKLIGEAIEIIAASDFTVATLSKLREQSTQLVQQKISSQDYQINIGKILPKLGAALQRAEPLFSVVIGILILALTTYSTFREDPQQRTITEVLQKILDQSTELTELNEEMLLEQKNANEDNYEQEAWQDHITETVLIIMQEMKIDAEETPPTPPDKENNPPHN